VNTFPQPPKRNNIKGTHRSRHGIFVDFDKICVFCDKCCVRIDKCVFIVVKIKCVNSGRICDICDKINFTTKLHTFYNTLTDIYQNTQHFIRIHSNIINFNKSETIPQQDLRISDNIMRVGFRMA
jgi:hypothetical protein